MTEAENFCNEILFTSGQITLISLIIPILVASFYRKQLTTVLKLFWAFCVFTLLFNLLEWFYIIATDYYSDYLNDWIIITGGTIHFFQILHQLKNFAFLGWFFSILLKDYKSGQWLKVLAIILCIATILFYIIEEGWKNYGTTIPPIVAIFLFVIPFFYLWYLFQTDLALPLVKNSFFWISLGLAAPNLIGLFLYFVGDSIYETDFCLFTRFATAKNIFEIIGQILIAIGFSQARFAKYVHPS